MDLDDVHRLLVERETEGRAPYAAGRKYLQAEGSHTWLTVEELRALWSSNAELLRAGGTGFLGNVVIMDEAFSTDSREDAGTCALVLLSRVGYPVNFMMRAIWDDFVSSVMAEQRRPIDLV